MDIPIWVILLVSVSIAIMGITMGSIGINFYKKCERRQTLNKRDFDGVIVMLTGFCVILLFVFVYAIILWRVHKTQDKGPSSEGIEMANMGERISERGGE